MSLNASVSRVRFNQTATRQPIQRTIGQFYLLRQRNTATIAAMKNWVEATLPRLNQAAYDGDLLAEELAARMNRSLLSYAPHVRELSLHEARQMLVILGLCGSSIERHAQQQAVRGGQPAAPGRGLGWLHVREQEPFLDYFGQVADLVGHPHRDTFVTFVEDNGPEIRVRHPLTGETLYSLPGVFSDGTLLGFSRQTAEREFILLLKEATALQGAANLFLTELQDPAMSVDCSAAINSALAATTLMQAIRAKMQEFMRVSHFTADFFLDVLRQYACPWTEKGLRPPSGANDDSALLRDVTMFAELLPAHGPFPGFRSHVRQVFSVLMPTAIEKLEQAMRAPSIEERVMQRLGLCRQELKEMDAARAESLLSAEPWLAAYVALFDAQRDVSRTHFATMLKYLVRPKQERDAQADPREQKTVVSNLRGTTGMDPMHDLRYLDDARAQHFLRRISDEAKTRIAQLLHTFGYSRPSHAEMLMLTCLGKTQELN